MKNVDIVFRARDNTSISIERVGKVLFTDCSSIDTLDKHAIILPKHADSIFSLIKNIFYCYRNTGARLHISGSEHYLTILSLFGKKVTLTIHDFVYYAKLRGYKRAIYFILWIYMPLRFPVRIAAISPKIKEEIDAWYSRLGINKSCYLVPNPITFSHTGKGDDRQLPPLKDRCFDLIQIGTASHKNAELAIRIAHQCGLGLLIIGQETPSIRSLINGKQNIVIQSNISNLQLEQHYMNSRLLIFLSSAEGFGLPIIEAQSLGTPVIISDIEPLVWVGGGGVAAVDQLDEIAVVEMVSSLLANEGRMKRMQALGFKNVERFNDARFRNNMEDFIFER